MFEAQYLLKVPVECEHQVVRAADVFVAALVALTTLLLLS